MIYEVDGAYIADVAGRISAYVTHVGGNEAADDWATARAAHVVRRMSFAGDYLPGESPEMAAAYHMWQDGACPVFELKEDCMRASLARMQS